MRTKEFEPTIALDKAMILFWQQGYAQTSMQNLVDTLGIHRRSIYDTFGDKHALFLKALQHYYAMVNQQVSPILERESTLSTQLTAIFNYFIHHDAQYPNGCLIINSAVELAAIDPTIDTVIQQYLEREKAVLKQLLIQAQDELRTPLDSDHLAATLQNALIGIRVMAKVTRDPQTLDTIVTQTLQTLPWKEVNSL